MAYCTCVPSNYKLTSEELLADYKQLKVRAVVVPYSRLSIGNDALIDGIRRAGMQLIGLKTSYDSRFTFSLVEDPKNRIRNSTSNASQISTTPSLNEANDIVISTDTLINMMPLFHIGGIIRNLLTPIFSGGSVIQCQGFDPVLFCDILAKQTSPVWFYGVASMQQSIIQEVAMRKLPSKYCDLVKKVCNAGGSLPPLLAKDIKATFRRATVLPSYGMTECMPICAPPIDYGLQLEGTSGRVAGPELAIAIDGNITFQDNIVGHILVRGGPCFEGYEDVDNSLTFDADGFFDTGDMGYMKDGFIYITCRSKEVINRGGEILSPLEIENVIVTHPRVAQVMAFSVPHQTLQEAVGCVIVPHDPNTRPDIPCLRTFLEKKLHPSKHPELLFIHLEQRKELTKVFVVAFIYNTKNIIFSISVHQLIWRPFNI
ncbi:putative CoA ligase CCL9, partial [Pseudolycoriella hygida]